jgi:hypothetical protein
MFRSILQRHIPSITLAIRNMHTHTNTNNTKFSILIQQLDKINNSLSLITVAVGINTLAHIIY